MSQIYNAAFDVDRINTVCEQLAGFILREIIGNCPDRRREGPTINMTCIFVNILLLL